MLYFIHYLLYSVNIPSVYLCTQVRIDYIKIIMLDSTLADIREIFTSIEFKIGEFKIKTRN